MASIMAFSHNLHFLLSLFTTTLLVKAFSQDASTNSTLMYPFPCSNTQLQETKTCNASLYHINTGLPIEQIASHYSVNSSQIKQISHGDDEQDYLITVPCTCNYVNGTRGYFYDTSYEVKSNDTFDDVSGKIYSGQALKVEGEQESFIIGNVVTMHLLCGCVESETQIVVTYTVQDKDTLSGIATLLSSQVSDIENRNQMLTQDPSFLGIGWVLFVPMEINGIPPPPKKGKEHGHWMILVFILSAVTLLSMVTLIIILLKRKQIQKTTGEDQKTVSKTMSTNKAFSLQSQYLHKENFEDMTAFESDRPLIFSLEEIEKATCDFDETKIIGRGGFGCVYYGVLGAQEVAIKKMRSNKSREFFAELKVLCKIHHINVVELLGYASGDDHLYLVYEYVRNGALSDHLHDPLLKGYQPLTWTARTQIALDAAKGIEYIHDHTKARYVHRDIKTSNILLDQGLRAKVADFGLVKLVERTNEEEMIATRLVGTPGYLPPESVKEFQVTTKTDVFAFGVVLAELITGQRALARDNREPNKMKSLITVVNRIFQDEEPENALEDVIDGNLRGSYPMEDVYKMAEIAEWCLSEEAVNRPEIREIVGTLSHIMSSSIEWDASLGGNSQVFSGLFNGR